MLLQNGEKYSKKENKIKKEKKKRKTPLNYEEYHNFLFYFYLNFRLIYLGKIWKIIF